MKAKILSFSIILISLTTILLCIFYDKNVQPSSHNSTNGNSINSSIEPSFPNSDKEPTSTDPSSSGSDDLPSIENSQHEPSLSFNNSNSYATADDDLVVIFKNWDGTVLDIQYVSYGMDVTYRGELPSREADDYSYTFVGWDHNLTNITDSFETTAMYDSEKRIYKYEAIETNTIKGMLLGTSGQINQNIDIDAQYTEIDVREGEIYYIHGYSWDETADINLFSAFFVLDNNGIYIRGSSYSEQIQNTEKEYKQECINEKCVIPSGGCKLVVLGKDTKNKRTTAKIDVKKYIDVEQDQEAAALFLGDSIVQGVGALPNYDLDALPSQDLVSVMERRLGYTILNGGIGGATFSRPYGRTSYWEASTNTSFADTVDELISGNYKTIYNHIEHNVKMDPTKGFQSGVTQFNRIHEIDINKLKYIGISYGTNDWYGNKGAGVTMDSDSRDDDTSTVLGALRYGIRKLKENFPDVAIVVFTPCYREKIGGTDGVNSENYVNLQGIKLEEFGDAVISCINELQIEFEDVYGKSMYQNPYFNEENANKYLTDGTHYNSEGYYILGNLYADYIVELQENGYLQLN